jgi:hypothetical protein
MGIRNSIRRLKGVSFRPHCHKNIYPPGFSHIYNLASSEFIIILRNGDNKKARRMRALGFDAGK